MKNLKNIIMPLFTVMFLSLFCELSAAGEILHTVEKGETYYSISKKYGITLQQLFEANGLTEGSVLKIGQTLKIRQEADAKKDADVKKETEITAIVPTKDYKVKKGDTLYSIARTKETSVAVLMQLNELASGAVLKEGQILKVPQDGASTVSANVNVFPELPSKIDPRTYDSKKKGDTSLMWPVKATKVTYVTGKISGVCLTADKNSDVTAIRGGKVTFSDIYRGFGKVVFVQASSGLIYVYCGLDSISVKVGDTVKCGDKLGVAGVDALTEKTQINLMVYQNGKVIDPAKAPRG